MIRATCIVLMFITLSIAAFRPAVAQYGEVPLISQEFAQQIGLKRAWVAQVPIDLQALDCDYYTASLHKWLCAPSGSGFLYAHARVQNEIQPAVLSWGKMLPDQPVDWTDEFTWLGTRDPSSYLAVPEAIRFMTETARLDHFRTHCHELAKYGVELVSQVFGLPLPTETDVWHGTMALAELPPGDAYELRESLWQQYKIEIPIVAWKDRRLIRISAHLYNTKEDMELLAKALKG